MTVLSEFLFCAFLSLFIVPQLFFRIFYYIPRIISFVAQKKLEKKSISVPFREMLVWVILVAIVYIVAFLISHDIGMMLLVSPMAMVCWLLGTIQIIVIVVTPRRREWQKSFYRNVYMKYATQQELDRYNEFVEMVDTLTPAEAMDILKAKDNHLTYLEKEALRARARATYNQQRIEKLHV